MSEPTAPTPPEDAALAAPAALPQAETTAPEPNLPADTADVPTQAATAAEPAPEEPAPATNEVAEQLAEVVEHGAEKRLLGIARAVGQGMRDLRGYVRCLEALRAHLDRLA